MPGNLPDLFYSLLVGAMVVAQSGRTGAPLPQTREGKRHATSTGGRIGDAEDVGDGGGSGDLDTRRVGGRDEVVEGVGMLDEVGLEPVEVMGLCGEEEAESEEVEVGRSGDTFYHIFLETWYGL